MLTRAMVLLNLMLSVTAMVIVMWILTWMLLLMRICVAVVVGVMPTSISIVHVYLHVNGDVAVSVDGESDERRYAPINRAL